MVWIDIVLIIILVVLITHGLLIGLIKGAFDIVGIILGYVLAIGFSDAIKLPRFLAFLLIFVIVVVGVSILGRVLSRFIHVTPLESVDRIFGGLLGFFKGLIISFVFLIIMLLLLKSDEAIYKSEVAPWIVKCGLTTSQVLPRKWYDWVEEVVTRRKLTEFQMPNSKCQMSFKNSNDQIEYLKFGI